jgi:hypothetical protein
MLKSQICQELRSVNGKEFVHCFYLNDYRFNHHQVKLERAIEKLTLVVNWQPDLTLMSDVPEGKLLAQCIFVD